MVRNLLRILWGCAFLQCFAQVAIAQTPALHWANTASGITGVSDANEVATDPAGFVYVAGEFAGTVDFNPGAGVASFSTPPPSRRWPRFPRRKCFTPSSSASSRRRPASWHASSTNPLLRSPACSKPRRTKVRKPHSRNLNPFDQMVSLCGA